MSDRRRAFVPFVIFLLGLVVVAILFATRPEVETHPIEVPLPIIRVESVAPAPFQFIVDAQGTVMPRTQSELISQVAGEVLWTSPSLAAGGFFEQGEPLLRIDRVDYEAELESERAALARAESEERRAGKDLGRQRRLADRSVASESRIDDAENDHKVALAVLRGAVAREGRAQRNLERTEILAPYPGRVRSENIDVGQYVSRGDTLAQIYAVDYAEIRLPIPDRELRFLDLPLTQRGIAASRAGDATTIAAAAASETASADAPPVVAAPPAADGPAVRLRAEFAGERLEWSGYIVRTEGEIDPRSRMVTVVARVEDPYGSAGPEGVERSPLAVGLFVSAAIAGVTLPDAVVLPRTALRGEDFVYVVDKDNRLRARTVKVLRRERERVIVGAGLNAGERVCVSPIPGAVEGMEVDVHGERAKLAGGAS